MQVTSELLIELQLMSKGKAPYRLTPRLLQFAANQKNFERNSRPWLAALFIKAAYYRAQDGQPFPQLLSPAEAPPEFVTQTLYHGTSAEHSDFIDRFPGHFFPFFFAANPLKALHYALRVRRNNMTPCIVSARLRLRKPLRYDDPAGWNDIRDTALSLSWLADHTGGAYTEARFRHGDSQLFEAPEVYERMWALGYDATVTRSGAVYETEAGEFRHSEHPVIAGDVYAVFLRDKIVTLGKVEGIPALAAFLRPTLAEARKKHPEYFEGDGAEAQSSLMLIQRAIEGGDYAEVERLCSTSN